MGQKIADFDLNWALLDCNFEFTNGYKKMHKAWSWLGEVPYYFLRSSVKFQGQMAKQIVVFLAKLGVSGL